MTATIDVATPALYRAPVQFRTATLETLDVDERIVELRAVPYGVEARLAPRVFEVFAGGAFGNAAKDPARVILYRGHSPSGGNEIGRALVVRDDEGGVFVRAKVSDTPAGHEALTLAADGVLAEASIEFRQIEGQTDVTRRGEDTLVRHRRAHLLGVALVPHGAYGQGAPVLSVRDERADRAREEWLARLRTRIS